MFFHCKLIFALGRNFLEMGYTGLKMELLRWPALNIIITSTCTSAKKLEPGVNAITKNLSLDMLRVTSVNQRAVRFKWLPNQRLINLNAVDFFSVIIVIM